VIELARRIVYIAGMTGHPHERWMLQIARNLTDAEQGALHGKSHLIIDRDTKYSAQFRRLMAEARTAVIRLPPRSPNLNAYAERFVRSIKEECLDRMILIGQGSLRRVIEEFMSHYHFERNHQGLENRLIRESVRWQRQGEAVLRRKRLGGMLSFYYRPLHSQAGRVSGHYGVRGQPTGQVRRRDRDRRRGPLLPGTGTNRVRQRVNRP
jgi:hypothetical protein